jgi:hypothetical protein
MSGFDLDILFDNNVLSLIDYSFDDPFLGNSLDLTEPDALPFFGSVREFGGVIDASAVRAIPDLNWISHKRTDLHS